MSQSCRKHSFNESFLLLFPVFFYLIFAIFDIEKNWTNKITKKVKNKNQFAYFWESQKCLVDVNKEANTTSINTLNKFIVQAAGFGLWNRFFFVWGIVHIQIKKRMTNTVAGNKNEKGERHQLSQVIKYNYFDASHSNEFLHFRVIQLTA